MGNFNFNLNNTEYLINTEFLTGIMSFLPFIIGFLLVWTLTLKGLALWRSSRKKSLGWFVFFLLINSLGLFELIYLLATKSEKEEPNSLSTQEYANQLEQESIKAKKAKELK